MHTIIQIHNITLLKLPTMDMDTVDSLVGIEIGTFRLNSLYEIPDEPYGYVNKIPIKTFEDSCRAISGDLVVVVPDVGIITSIIERTMKTIVGTLILNSRSSHGYDKRKVPYFKFVPQNRDEYPEFLVATRKEYNSVNVYCLLKVVEWKSDSTYPYGVLENVIGKVGDFNSEVVCMKHRNNIPLGNIKIKNTGGAQKSNKSRGFNIEDYSIDLTPLRIDFRDLNVFSVDPPLSMDIDDAIHIRNLNDGIVEIGIHIADVSSFIPLGSPLDGYAKERCETVYFSQFEKVSMLPPELSEDLCSLLEGKERRTFSTIITFNNNEVVNIEHVKGLVVVRHNYTYEEAQNEIQGKIANDLSKLYEFGRIMTPYCDYDIHKMIEFFMVLCNNIVACFLSKSRPKDCLLRIHKRIDGVDGVDGINNQNIYNRMRASYISGCEGNIGHSSLQLNNYTHMTSPIRRYFDIMVHRMLYETLYNISEMETNYQPICDYLNVQRYNIKMASIEFNRLFVIFDICKNSGSVIDVFGTIIRIDDNKINVFVEELNLDVICYVIPKKLIRNVAYESDDKSLRILESGMTLNLNQRIKIRISITLQEHELKKKINVQILE